MGGLFGLVVSTAYICLTSLIAWWARKLVDRICLKISVRKILLLEAVATWEMCAACFELIIVADNYGVSTYALYLFLLTIWWSKNWGDATACPYTHIEEYVEGKTWISHVFAKILCQLIGGLLTYRYVLFLWSLEVSSTHRGRAYEACTADLQVSAIMGAIIEGCATCICRVLSRALAEIQTKFGTELEAFIGTSLVVAGMFTN
ncbi:hypothetical protein O3M35_009397 [Rhynocoris fuscipes]|uniref:Aquaporin n=1 Tax=Rhynocoris fuscipes TaxID=488301 RepID=A0AAW1D5H4_9HEMI